MKSSRELSYHLLRLSQKEKWRSVVDIRGNTFIIYPDVFSPKYFNDTAFFIECLPYLKNTTMLEIGTGIGALPIIAVLDGVRKVTATDINPAAVRNAKENVKQYHLSNQIKVIKSDLFNKLKKKRFDLIFFNCPFCFTKKKNLTFLEKSLFDYEYTILDRFIRECGCHVTTRGRIFLGFSSFFGDFNKLKEIAQCHKRKIRVIKRIGKKRGNQMVSLELLEIV